MKNKIWKNIFLLGIIAMVFTRFRNQIEQFLRRMITL